MLAEDHVKSCKKNSYSPAMSPKKSSTSSKRARSSSNNPSRGQEIKIHKFPFMIESQNLSEDYSSLGSISCSAPSLKTSFMTGLEKLSSPLKSPRKKRRKQEQKKEEPEMNLNESIKIQSFRPGFTVSKNKKKKLSTYLNFPTIKKQNSTLELSHKRLERELDQVEQLISILPPMLSTEEGKSTNSLFIIQ